MFAFFKKLFRKKEPKKVKLGLALGSGGAKGFAHLGALQAFDEAGIEFDLFAGASIGAVVGSLCADDRYSITDVRKIFENIDYGELLSLKIINMNPEKLYNLFDSQLHGKTFEELGKPLKVIATDYANGDQVIFDSGEVAPALSASSCYLPFFKPYEYNGKTYVDGAFCNSVPADVAKSMGADLVVGIDLSAFKRPIGWFEQLLMGETYKYAKEDPSKAGYENAEIMLRPDLSAYSAISFKSADEMFEIGYNEAKRVIPELKAKIDEVYKKINNLK